MVVQQPSQAWWRGLRNSPFTSLRDTSHWKLSLYADLSNASIIGVYALVLVVEHSLVRRGAGPISRQGTKDHQKTIVAQRIDEN